MVVNPNLIAEIDPSTIAPLTGFTGGNFSVVLLNNSSPCFLDLSGVSSLSGRAFRLSINGTITSSNSASNINVSLFRGSSSSYPGGTNLLLNTNPVNSTTYGFTSYIDCVWDSGSNNLGYTLYSAAGMNGNFTVSTSTNVYSSISQSLLKFEVACSMSSPSVGDTLVLNQFQAYYI